MSFYGSNFYAVNHYGSNYYGPQDDVVLPTYNFFRNVFTNILREVHEEVWTDDKCC